MESAQRVVKSGRYILGPEVAAFEREFAIAQGVPHCLGVGSGTHALEISLAAFDIGPGDEVIVPAFSFIATASCVSVRGAKPVFVDVDPDTLTIDPQDFRRKITPKTKAVIPVHLFGRTADMDGLRAAAGTGIRIIEDCAQSHLARYKGRPAGALGDVAAFSFYPTKNLGALGDAGALTTAKDDIRETLVSLRDCGRNSKRRYDHDRIGYNSRLDELQAAFLRVKLRRLVEWTDARRKLVARYRRALADVPLRLTPEESEGSFDACHVFAVRTDRRDALKDHLRKSGIGTAVFYPQPIPLQTAYADLGGKTGDCPASEQAAREILSLPLYPELGSAKVDRVVEAIRVFFKK